MEDRDALYYPFIHVRDVNWLKGTLLCFPHVFRMTPPGFSLNDSQEVRPFGKTKGRQQRPLLDQAELYGGSVASAQRRFLRKLEQDYEENGREMHERFSLVRARRDYPHADGENLFQIHRDKFSIDLLSFLDKTGLAWQPAMPNRRNEWVALHPALGEAFMSTMAAAVARSNGLDIVTSSGPVHSALALKNEDALYDQLVRRRQVYAKPRKTQVANQLIQLVVRTRFDISRLSARDIASMSKDREGLFALREEISKVASRIPAMDNRRLRDRYLAEAADEIIEHWQDSKKGMSKFARRFFGKGMAAEASSFAQDVSKTIVSGGAAVATSTALVGGLTMPVFLGAGAGLAIGVLVHGISTARDMYAEEKRSAYRYLTRIEKAGATFMVAAPYSREGDN